MAKFQSAIISFIIFIFHHFSFHQSPMCTMDVVTADIHKSCFFSPKGSHQNFTLHNIHFSSCSTTHCLVNILLRRSRRRWWKKKTYINDESALCRESYGSVPHSSEAVEMTSHGGDSCLFQCSPPSIAFFEDGANNYSVLTHNHFIKQVSQTVGQR